jgi:excisionase family DNA binding protein
MPQEYYTLGRLTDILGLGERAITRRIKSGKLKAYKVGREWRVDPDAVKDFLADIKENAYSPAEAHSDGEPKTSDGDDLGIAPNGLAHLRACKDTLTYLQEVVLPIYERMMTMGVLDVLAPRGESEETKAQIAEALQRAVGIMWLQGISLKEFFGDREYTSFIRQKVDAANSGESDGSLEVRAILLNPDSTMARARAVLENGMEFADEEGYHDSILYEDIRRSHRFLDGQKQLMRTQGATGFSLHYTLLDFLPPQYVVMTKDECFMETYHFGTTKYEPGTCIGRRVPMLKLSPDSALYQSLRSQMEYFWDNDNPHLKIVRCYDHPASRAKMAGGETLHKKTRLPEAKQLTA